MVECEETDEADQAPFTVEKYIPIPILRYGQEMPCFAILKKVVADDDQVKAPACSFTAVLRYTMKEIDSSDQVEEEGIEDEYPVFFIFFFLSSNQNKIVGRI